MKRLGDLTAISDCLIQPRKLSPITSRVRSTLTFLAGLTFTLVTDLKESSFSPHILSLVVFGFGSWK